VFGLLKPVLARLWPLTCERIHNMSAKKRIDILGRVLRGIGSVLGPVCDVANELVGFVGLTTARQIASFNG
jgi:hypothetical protein